MMRRGGIAGQCLLLCCAWIASANDIDYDRLLYRALREGNTAERKTAKEAAQKELFELGPDALREIMARVHMENIMLQVFAFELVANHVPAATGAPILTDSLSSGDAQTRRVAAYLLGFYPRTEPAIPRILSMLDVEKERNVALRTLGTWRVEEAREAMRALLHSEAERTRLAACIALGKFNDTADVPALIEALGDPAFLVRNAAARALLAQGRASVRPLRSALSTSSGIQRRQIVRVLGALQHGSSRDVRRLWDDADPGLRGDALWAAGRSDAPWIWEEPYY